MNNLQEYRNLYDSLHKYFVLLTSTSIFYRNSEERVPIGDAANLEVSLFKFLAKKVNEESVADELIDRFKSLFNVQEEIANTVDYSSEKIQKLKDEINYLKVCVKNICNVDLDSANIQELKKEEEEIKKQESYKQDTVVSEEIFQANLEDSQVFEENVKNIGELIIKSHAYERLHKDIKEGVIYIYLSKPRINVIVKYVLLCLFCISLVMCGTLLFLIIKNSFKDGSDTDYLLSHDTLAFLFIGVMLYCSLSNIHSISQSLKNDNFKYAFPKKEFIFTWVAGLLAASVALKDNLTNAEKTFEYFVSLILLLVIAFLCILYLVAYLCLQPQKNKKLIDETLKKHMSDLSSDYSLK